MQAVKLAGEQQTLRPFLGIAHFRIDLSLHMLHHFVVLLSPLYALNGSGYHKRRGRLSLLAALQLALQQSTLDSRLKPTEDPGNLR